jgi:hypothetical protein
VFVHGAWADASGFGGVIRALGDDRGFTAIGMANRLRHLARVHGVAAGGRDAADPERRGGDQPQPAVRV